MEETTVAAPIQTDATSTEAAVTSLLTSTETPAGDQQQASVTETPAGEVAVTETKPEGSPEKYEFTAPEGKSYDNAVLDSFSTAAKAANLTQDAAQKLLESMAPALAERQAAQVQAVQTGWLEASRTDKEFGGEKLQENLGIAKKAMDLFDPIPAGQKTTELRTLLDSTGFGNNPTILRFIYRAGKALSEDKFVTGKAEQAPRQIKDILYDKTGD